MICSGMHVVGWCSYAGRAARQVAAALYALMDCCNTYMFELCHPNIINVVRQMEPRLWQLATRRVFPDEAMAASGATSAYAELIS